VEIDQRVKRSTAIDWWQPEQQMINGTYIMVVTLALLSNQNHKSAFKFIFFKVFHEEIFLNFFVNC